MNKKLTIKSLQNAIQEYQSTTKLPTFTGLLNRIGLPYSQWTKMKGNGTKEAYLLEMYLQHLEEQMEKRLIYQEEKGYYNYNALMFVLKNLNKDRYQEQKQETIKANPTLDFFKDMKNVSGISVVNAKVVKK